MAQNADSASAPSPVHGTVNAETPEFEQTQQTNIPEERHSDRLLFIWHSHDM